MKKFVDGEYIEMTEAEIKELQNSAGDGGIITPEKRIEALEAAMLELILGGASNG